MICYESPTNVPTLIKNGIIPAIFESLERHLPVCADLMTGSLTTIYHIILH